MGLIHGEQLALIRTPFILVFICITFHKLAKVIHMLLFSWSYHELEVIPRWCWCLISPEDCTTYHNSSSSSSITMLIILISSIVIIMTVVIVNFIILLIYYAFAMNLPIQQFSHSLRENKKHWIVGYTQLHIFWLNKAIWCFKPRYIVGKIYFLWRERKYKLKV